MSVQDDINKALDELSDKMLGDATRSADDVIDKVDSYRKEISGILLEYSNKDGTISERRLRSLLRELDEIEDGIGEEIYEHLESSVEETSNAFSKEIVGLLIAGLGVAVVFGGKDKRPSNDSLTKEITDFVFNKEINGIKLSNRINVVSGILRDEIQKAIRQGVNSGESITKISQRVKKSFDKTVWQVKRIITTEIPVAFRKGIALIGGKAGIIKAVKIIDNRGRHKYHESHECYRLAEQDKYGMGKGVYKPSDSFIFNPHPQCSAYFHYILKDDELPKEDD